jgi:hypothetical protein
VWCGVSGGVANAYTLTPSLPIIAYVAGQTFEFMPVESSTGAVTVDVSGVGAKEVFGATGSALVGGELSSTGVARITYDGTQFRLVNGIGACAQFRGRADGVQVRYADSGSSVGPDLQLFRNSTTPANNDLIAKISWLGRNDAAETIEYALIDVQLADVADGTEDAVLRINTVGAGSLPATPTFQLADFLTLTTADNRPLVLNRTGSSGQMVRMESGGSARAQLISSGNNNLGITPTVSGSFPATPTIDMQGTDTSMAGALVVAGSMNTGDGVIAANRAGATPLVANRNTNDGTVISIRQDTAEEGAISVSGTTVTYGSFLGAHWAGIDGGNPEVGTWLQTTDRPFVIPSDTKRRDALAYVEIATPGSRAVCGAYHAPELDDSGEQVAISVGAVGGPMFCRVTGPATAGDLLTIVKPGVAGRQSDDILRSSTCAKVWCGDDREDERLVSVVFTCG